MEVYRTPPRQTGPLPCRVRTWIFTNLGVAAARGVRCGSVFHVIWNQEREKAGLDQKESHDTSAAIQVGMEALKILIRRDRGE